MARSKRLLILLGLIWAGLLPATTLPKLNFPMTGSTFVVFGNTSPITHNAQLPALVNWPTFQNSAQQYYSFTNTIELNQIETTALTVDFDYELTVQGTLKYWVIGSSTPITSTITLRINSAPSLKTDRRLDYHSYSNAYKSEYEIQSITLTTQGTMVPNALYGAVSEVVELNFGIQGREFTAPVYNTVPALHSACVDGVTNELVVDWTPVGFAEEYELEITYRDDYTDNISVLLPASSIPFDFRENATRIVTKQTHYRIPLTYERGYLLYRVRAIGMGGPEWDKRIPCRWSGATSGTVAAFPDRYGPIGAHVSDAMNWQLNTTYSDEGKRKDVAQYYDGLYMSRQTVTGVSQRRNIFTQNPSDPTTAYGCAFFGSDKIKEVIAQEVIYDFNGRPALQILPVPTGTRQITYIKNLNNNSAGQSYSWQDFDLSTNCKLIAQPLSSSVNNALGAAAYYSPNNPNKIGYNAFIPNSKGYPFSRVQYTPDNTGRVYRQGGVGDIYQLEQGHETKFFYAKPNQVELDRMFGNEVGYAIRYQKNMVVDPNGQVSVSYMNPEGKTIATALAGKRPDNLLELDNEKYPPEVIPVNLLASNESDNNAHSLTVSEPFVVTQETNYTFTYNVNGETLTYSSCNKNQVCLDCIYDLDISLIDNVGCTSVPLFNYSGTFGDLIKSTEQPYLDLDCLDEKNPQSGDVAKPANFPTSFTKKLVPGSYTLVKTLKVNKTAADAYIALVFKDTCQSVLQQYLAEETAKIDTMACYQTCSSCLDSNVTTPTNCDDLCPKPLNECDQARASMRLDVSPGGQYGQYDVTIVNNVNVYDASSYPLSVFNPGNSLPGHPNWQNMPGAPSDLQTLILNWDETTSPNYFLQFHPEHCMLEWCDTKNTGKDFDVKLSETTTYSVAISSGLLTTPSSVLPYRQLIAQDPFFGSGGGGAAQATAFGILLDNPNFPCLPTGPSILQMAMDVAYCQSQPGFQQVVTNTQNGSGIGSTVTNPPTPTCTIPAGYHTSHVFGSDPATKDLEWRLLRDFYLTHKEKFLYESRKAYSIANGCFNSCIGAAATSYWYSGPPLLGRTGRGLSVEGTVPVNISDPCGAMEFLYEGKVKRFTNRYDAFTSTGVSLSGIDLYGCLTPAQVGSIKSQLGATASEYICDTCTSCPASTSNKDCWTLAFETMVNEWIPTVNALNPVILSGSQIGPRVRDMFFATAGIHVTQVKLEYVSKGREYRISLLGDNDKSVSLSFPTSVVNDAPKQLNSICCITTQEPQAFNMTLQYSDRTSASVRVVTTTQLPICPPRDTCTKLSPLTSELLNYLNQKKDKETSPRLDSMTRGRDSRNTPLRNDALEIRNIPNRRNCTLTFTILDGKIVGDDRRTLDVRQSRDVGLVRDVRATDTTTKNTKGTPCTITFANCEWMTSASHLVSIKPFFVAGQGNVLTKEFILTYVRFNGKKLDTFTVRGTSDCIPINNCHKPYFCDKDSLLQPLPPSDINGCVQAQVLTATFVAQSRYSKWLDSMQNDLRQKYYARCMQAKESIAYEYTDHQYHFTLYYYDQAGNLVRTVPPAGVRLLHPSDAPTIDYKRDHPVVNNVAVAPMLPNHTYITNYAYNSLNQNRWQSTPDAGKSIFLYDRLGRIVASRNAVQEQNDTYSYTWYDMLGRVVESGMMQMNGGLSQAIVSNYSGWKNFLYTGTLLRRQITYTQYDESFTPAVSGKFGPVGQQNLRGRVASVLSFEDNVLQAAGKYRHATHYTYDVTGNVPVLIQDYPNTPLGDKAIAYNYDLVSGKVNEVRYSPGEEDEFRQRYGYDDELRLTSVSTSRKGIVWETEAEYFYYKHGPLARVELGQLKVQGLDYLYTLQGWIKGVNGTTQERGQDAGRDGIALEQPGPVQTVMINGQQVTVQSESNPSLNISGPGYHSLHNPVGADAFGYVLNYYTGDYDPIVSGLNPTASMNTTIGDVKPLYNGNISRMYTWLQGLDGLGMNYRYDQLNRLKKQEAFAITNGTQALLADNAYGMELTYDGSGNIITLHRNGRVGNPKMDALEYHYLDAVNGVIPDMANPPGNATNRLGYVDDETGYTPLYPEVNPINGTVTDIDDQSAGNYAYDAIGNLIKDISENIDKIEWNLQNKITAIKKTTGFDLQFDYDALGNRVRKYVTNTKGETFYVRDALGSIMAIYTVENGQLLLREQNMYGSSRLGVWNADLQIAAPGQGLTNSVDWQDIRAISLTEDSTTRGSRQYELSNHLGNVLATISDRRLQVGAPATGASGVSSDLLSATDYYAFGMGMPGRDASVGEYRYGMNGQERDKEVFAGAMNAQYWEYDSRTGKRWNLDPITNSSSSPYACFNNNPVLNIDRNGDSARKNTPVGQVEVHKDGSAHPLSEGTYPATPLAAVSTSPSATLVYQFSENKQVYPLYDNQAVDTYNPALYPAGNSNTDNIFSTSHHEPPITDGAKIPGAEISVGYKGFEISSSGPASFTYSKSAFSVATDGSVGLELGRTKATLNDGDIGFELFGFGFGKSTSTESGTYFVKDNGALIRVDRQIVYRKVMSWGLESVNIRISETRTDCSNGISSGRLKYDSTFFLFQYGFEKLGIGIDASLPLKNHSNLPEKAFRFGP